MIDDRDRYVSVIFVSPLGMEREEVSGLMLPSEAAMTAGRLEADRRRGVRPDIKEVVVFQLRKAI